MTGLRFGALTVVAFTEVNSRGQAMWKCRCDCGAEKVVSGTKLREGQIKSCGCLHYKYGHGKTNTRLYHIWRTMKARCLDKNSQKYNRYGGRGISIYEEWRENFQSFFEWAMANGYRDDLSIDRIDVDGNYEPGNCQWITISENSKKAWKDRGR